tara:strand:- start:143 stop:424 length:282 start_codon:yes stop_codon:yes gene_type:complete
MSQNLTLNAGIVVIKYTVPAGLTPFKRPMKIRSEMTGPDNNPVVNVIDFRSRVQGVEWWRNNLQGLLRLDKIKAGKWRLKFSTSDLRNPRGNP